MRAASCVGRIGGLAVALGVGAGVAILGAGSASASPGDDSVVSAPDDVSASDDRRSQASRPEPRTRSVQSVSENSETEGRAAPEGHRDRATRPRAAAQINPSEPDTQNESSPLVPNPVYGVAASAAVQTVPTRSAGEELVARPPDSAAESVTPVAEAAVDAADPASSGPESVVAVANGSPERAQAGTVEAMSAPSTHWLPGLPGEAAVSWVMVAAARRELGDTLVTQGSLTESVAAGRPLDPESVRAAAATVTTGTPTQSIDPASAETPVDPITAIFQQVSEVFSGIVQAVTGVITGIVTAFNQIVSAIVGIFIPPAPVNTAPTVSAPTASAPDATTGVVTGQVSAADADGDTLIYSAPASTAKGSVSINTGSGEFTFTPTVAARENAARDGATAADKTDTFTVTVADGNGGSAAVLVTVQVGPIYRPNTVIARLAVSPVYSAPRGLVISPDGRRVFVLNAGGGQVAVVDALTNTLATPLTVTNEPGFRPNALAVSPDGSILYAANTSPNIVGLAQAGTVSIVNIGANVITDRLEFDLGTDPGTIVTSPDGQRVYVTSTDETGASRIWVLDTNTNSAIHSLTGVRPTGLFVSPDSKTLYVGTKAGELLFVDTESYVVTGGVNIDGPFVMSPDGRRVYTSNSGTVSTVDIATNTVIGTVRVGSQSAGMAISPDGRHLYVADYYGDSVSVVNTATNTVTATIIVDRVPSGVVISPDGSRLYVASSAGGTVSVIAT